MQRLAGEKNLIQRLRGKSPKDDIEVLSIDHYQEPSRYHVDGSLLCKISSSFTIFLLLADITLDMYVAFFIRYNKSTWQFALTLTFVLLPGLFTALFRFVQNELYRRRWEHKQDYLKVPPGIQLLRWMLSFFCLTSVTSEIEYIYYGNERSKLNKEDDRRKKYTLAMSAAKLQGSVVRVMEALLEAAPQLLLSLYFELSSGYDFNLDVYSWTSQSWLLAVSSGFSFISLTWNIRTFYSIHCHYRDQVNLQYRHQVILFLGRFLMMVSRMAAFVTIAKLGWLYFVGFAAVHFALVHRYLCWVPMGPIKNIQDDDTHIRTTDNDDIVTKTKNNLVFILSRICYFFIDIDLKWEKCTDIIWPYKLCLYSGFLLENIGMLSIWYWVEGSEQTPWIYRTFSGVGIGGYVVGCLFMILFINLSKRAATKAQKNMCENKAEELGEI